MTNDPSSGEKDDLDLARRLLRSIGSKDGTKAGAAREPREPAAAAGTGGSDTLGRLVDALKRGTTEITAIEPPGYGHFETIRTGARTFAKGARGDAIDALQGVLARLGIDGVPKNGRFDEATEGAVRRFQEKNGCPVTGVLDAATVEAFDRALGLPDRRVSAEAAQKAEPDSAADELASGNPFIDRIAPGAIRGMHETGLPASIQIALAILESRWGEAVLARDYGNIFGLRGEGPAGSVTMDETGTRPGGTVAFRRYDDAADSVADHAKAFVASERYRGIMSHASHPENMARALSGVYSDDANYGTLVLRIMKQFDLQRYDRAPKPPTGGKGR
jgi:flagellum-specific peptidoglycan hydrolase FlgJ